MNLQEHYKQMSAQYKQQKSHTATEETRAAYIAARLPATYAVVKAVITRMLYEKNVEEPLSILDLGAGPGTATMVLEDIVERPFSATLIERDQGFIQLGKDLLQGQYTWICANILNIPYVQHDWVIASYSLNELPLKTQRDFIQKAFEASKQFLILIEPGTPKGFENILKARDVLIKNGAHVTLPCPHNLKCPIEGTSSWCHFSQRISRTKLHKAIKNAELGYENEKYCYLVVSKNTSISDTPRIISTPKKHSGHLEFSLCLSDGSIGNEILSKSKCPSFKEMKKKSWGDTFNLETTTEDA